MDKMREKKICNGLLGNIIFVESILKKTFLEKLFDI